MLTTVRRQAGRITTGLLVLLALALAAVFLVPKALGYELYAITTGSMTGTVDPGGLVVAEQVPVAELEVGDVITYMPPPTSGLSNLVTHRITRIAPDPAGVISYRTKGDANPAADPWTFTLDSPVQARMVWSAPALGRPILLLADPDLRRLVIVVPAVLIGLFAAADVVRALRPLPAAQPQPELQPQPEDEAGPAAAVPAPRSAAVPAPAPGDIIDLTDVRPVRTTDLTPA